MNLCIHVCRQICIYLHTYTLHICMDTSTCMHICIHVHRQTYLGMYVCMYVHKCTYYRHTCMNLYNLVYIWEVIHECMCMLICTFEYVLCVCM